MFPCLAPASKFVFEIPNPIGGKSPDFTAFGTTFNTKAVALLLGIWAVGILIAIYYLTIGLVAMGKARGNNPAALSEARGQAKAAALGLGALAALPMIVGAILSFVG